MSATTLRKALRPSPSPSPEPLYSPLRLPFPTRLLTLQPGKSPQPLSATLSEVSLNDNPSYEYLSYTWGEDLTGSTITVNDIPLQIRRNLCQFLHRIRLPDQPRVLWVDAISISQDNLNEKAMQVEMISSIFHSAQRVLVWLGEHAEGSEALFGGWPWKTGRLPARGIELGRDQETVSAEEAEYRARVWTAFLSRPYWSRTWIIQEIVLARELLCYCGPDVASWDELLGERLDPRTREPVGMSVTATKRNTRSLNVLARELTGNALKPVSNLCEARILYGRHDQPQQPPKTQHYANIRDMPRTTAVLSTLTRYTRCADKRDKIYAVLSIDPSEMLREEVEIDYRISAVELFVRVMRVLGRVDDGVLPEWMVPTSGEGVGRRKRNWVHISGRLRTQMGLDSKEELMGIVDEILDMCEAGQILAGEEVRMAIEAAWEAIEELKTIMGAIEDPDRGKIEWPPHLSVGWTQDEVLEWRAKVRREGRWPMPKSKLKALGGLSLDPETLSFGGYRVEKI
jgi:hypothetical protein